MTREHVELIREGDVLAEVRVQLVSDDDSATGWGPYLSLDDAARLERVRRALRAGDLNAAMQDARLFHLTPAA